MRIILLFNKMTGAPTLERGRVLVRALQEHPERNLGIDMRLVEARVFHGASPILEAFIERWGTCRPAMRRGNTYLFAAMDTVAELRGEEDLVWVDDDVIGQYEKAMASQDTRRLRHSMVAETLKRYRRIYEDVLSRVFNPNLSPRDSYHISHAVYDTVGPLLVVRGLI